MTNFPKHPTKSAAKATATKGKPAPQAKAGLKARLAPGTLKPSADSLEDFLNDLHGQPGSHRPDGT